MHLDGIVLDGDAGPDRSHQLIFGDQRAIGLCQHRQNGQRLGLYLNRMAAVQKLTKRLQRETPDVAFLDGYHGNKPFAAIPPQRDGTGSHRRIFKGISSLTNCRILEKQEIQENISNPTRIKGRLLPNVKPPVGCVSYLVSAIAFFACLTCLPAADLER